MRLLLEAGRETLSLDGRGAWPSAGGAFVCTGETKKTAILSQHRISSGRAGIQQALQSAARVLPLLLAGRLPLLVLVPPNLYSPHTPPQPLTDADKVPANWAQASHLWSELQLVSWLGRAAARGEPRPLALAPARFGWVAAAGAGLRETAGLRLSCKRHRAEDIPLRAWKGHLADGRLPLRCRDTNPGRRRSEHENQAKTRWWLGGDRGAQARAARRCDSACADCHCCLCHRAASSSYDTTS